MRFNVVDCELHTDAIHRGGGQIMPAARRLYYALEMLSDPTLLEPIFSCDITAPMDCMGGVYQSLTQRRGQVVEEIQISGTPLNLVFIGLPRLKHSCQSQNPSDSQVCYEATHKARLSLNVCSIIGNLSKVSLSPTTKQENWCSASASGRDSRMNCLSWKIISTRCD